MRPRSCVLLFARSPHEEGAVKGRCGGDRHLAALFTAWRRLFTDELQQVAPDVTLVVVGDGEAPAGALQLAQRGADFGARIRHAFADVRALGFTHIAAIPGDVPALQATDITAALAALQRHAVVFGPSPDGGIYLLAGTGDLSSVLDDVRWCSGHVQTDLRSAVARRRLETMALRSLADVDDITDVARVAVDRDLHPALFRLVQSFLRPRTLPLPVPAGAHPQPRSRLLPARAPPAPPLG